ncbi:MULTISPECIES: UxaA family hydrolase [unclassified Spirosoma]|uniref:UxaA family hydrolase n=1 Tax=unclassified Spirosoma TaxID=2621999 RepID=UPI00095F8EB6|nr:MULTISPECIES: altronate dehydratase family protein [unclassified Spirosoma]MBN8823845.1 altronate dehydratase [Spirosoma sp.]OJW79762.1 MAG: altronate hydrolase [Spirosoma sp. 48-14]
MAARVLKVHPADNVIVALRNLSAGEQIEFDNEIYELPYTVGAKHKFVTEDRQPGDPITMYGVLVGKATQPIRRGEPITTFNLKHDADRYGLDKKQPYSWQAPDVSPWQNRTFMGYHRADGSVGTRNYWLVVPLVFCENRNVLILKDAFERELGYAQPEIYREQVHELISLYKAGELDVVKKMQPFVEPAYVHQQVAKRPFKNVDGIKFLTHEMGCGGTRQDSAYLGSLLAGFINNPNVAGATVLSLGCQHLQVDMISAEIKRQNPKFDKPLLLFEQQAGTEYTLMSQAIKETFLGLIEVNKIERQPAPLSKLTVGLKCGGSDGFSGISANPVLGQLSDILVTLGGKTVLAEFPELNGVEQELINRTDDTTKAQKFIDLMSTYSAQAEAVGSGFDMNPSPGNIKDGLITDAIKSAGAAKKGGTSPVADVLDYAEPATTPGLNLLCTPGNDVEATTGMAGSGTNVIVFTTGLGTPTGNPICPVVKVSTNTTLKNRMPDVIDFDSGPIIDGEQTIEQNADAMLEYIIRLASGEETTQAERLGQDDFIPWKRGVSL